MTLVFGVDNKKKRTKIPCIWIRREFDEECLRIYFKKPERGLVGSVVLGVPGYQIQRGQCYKFKLVDKNVDCEM